MNEKGKRVFIIIWMMFVLCGGVYGGWRNFKEYHVVVQNTNATKNPIDIANKYMQTKYDNLWKSIDGIDYAGQESEIISDYVYEMMMWEVVDEKIYQHQYSIWNDARDGICCETQIGSPGITIGSKYFGEKGEIETIFCAVDVYNEEGYWEEKYFNLYRENGEYVCYIYENQEYLKVDIHDMEKIMELTSDEIVLIAQEQQKQVENLMLKIKDIELINEKNKMLAKDGGIMAFVLVNIGILYSSIKKNKCDK